MAYAGSVNRLDGPESDRILLTFPQQLPPGPVTLHATFDYVLSEGLLGFYRSEILGADGLAHSIAVTQFESMSARKAFPCLDEPALKVRSGACAQPPYVMLTFTSRPYPQGRCQLQEQHGN